MEADGVRLSFTAPDPMPAWIEPPKPAPVVKGTGPKAGAGPRHEEAGRAAGRGTPGEPETPSPDTGPPADAEAPSPPEPGSPPATAASPAPEAAPASEATPAPDASPSPPPRASGFNAYRRTEPGSYGAPLNAEPLLEAAYLDAAAPLLAQVCYQVRTVVSDDPLIESEATPEACVRVEDKKAPAAPTGVATLPVGDGIEVSWSPSSETDLVLYRVYRKARGAAAVPVAEVKAPDTSAVDGEAELGQRFQYYVTAIDAAGNESPPSDAAEGVRR
jgi:hypothetical protein